jgi:hypothetical protein
MSDPVIENITLLVPGSYSDGELLSSIAISLKRIADSLKIISELMDESVNGHG